MGAPMLPDVEEVASAFRGDDLPQAPREDTIALTSIQGAISKRLAPGRWRLHAVAPTDAVPTAAVDSGTCRYTISLPIAQSPSSSDSHTCYLEVDTSARGGRPDAWMAPERTVARALQNMLASGHLSSAARTADDATEALREKYETGRTAER